MSLISDALKEAQRSRSQRTGTRASIPLADTFFPYPEGKKTSQRSSMALRIGAVIVGVLVIASAVVVRSRLQSTRRTPPPIARPAVVAAAPIIAQAPVPTTAAPSIPAGRTNAKVTPANKPPASQTVAKTAAPPAAKATNHAAAPAAPAPKQVVDATPPVADPPRIKQQSVNASGIQVVLDANSARPSDSLFKQAYAEQTRGNFERSKELYEKTIALPQAPAEAFNNYGVLLLQSGNQLGATEMFTQALKRDDKNVDAWINLGDSYNLIGHHVEAMGAYARAGQLDASNAALKVRLAAEYAAIGDTAVARRTYEDAVKSAPKDPNVHYNFGKFLQAQRDFRGAIREYQAFVDLAPGKFSAENIAMIRQYIVTLSPYAR